MACSLFLFSTRNTHFGQTWSKNQNWLFGSWCWNFVLRLIQIWTIQRWCSFFVLSAGSILFGGNLFQKVKIVCWNWNLEHCGDFLVFYFFYIKNTLFGLIWSKNKNIMFKLKLGTYILNMQNSIVMFIFPAWDLFASFDLKIHLAFWCYPISLSAVYLQIPEASGFSCFYWKGCALL